MILFEGKVNLCYASLLFGVNDVFGADIVIDHVTTLPSALSLEVSTLIRLRSSTLTILQT